jgi:uracil-DNA glycosylase
MSKELQPDFWSKSRPDTDLGAARLTAWAPERWCVAEDWAGLVQAFFESADGLKLEASLSERLAQGAIVYPPEPLRALALTPLSEVRVVIVGQDPYHGAGQAEGLAFSVAAGVKFPPSLRNIFKEIERDPLAGFESLHPRRAQSPGRVSGSLVSWAQQGVLLLNTCLTVEQELPASHAKLGWHALTVQILKAVSQKKSPVVFMLWGNHAQQFASLIPELGAAGRPMDDMQVDIQTDRQAHLTLLANHPSPLSALRAPLPFIGCGHFGRANAYLSSRHCLPIDWLGATTKAGGEHFVA